MNKISHRTVLRVGFLPLLVLAVSMVWTGTATADVRFPDDRELVNFGLQHSFKSWTIEDETSGDEVTVRQFATRLKATVDVHPDVDLVVYTAGGFSQDRRGVVSEISGLADTKIKAYGFAWEDQLVLSLGVNIPTGVTSLDDEDVKAVQAVSPNVLGFRMKDYGGGTDLDLATSVGFDLGHGWTVGGGLSYLFRGEYDLDTRSTYGPGNEFSITAGSDWRRGRLLLSLDTLYRGFGKDSLGSSGTFSNGDQFETSARALWRKESWGTHVFLRHIYKQDGEFTWDRPASETRVDNGHNLWFAFSPYYQPNGVVSLRALIDYVTVEQSQQQARGAWSLGYGCGVDVRLTPRAILEVRSTRLVGRNEDSTVKMSGFDSMVTVRWQY